MSMGSRRDPRRARASAHVGHIARTAEENAQTQIQAEVKNTIVGVRCSSSSSEASSHPPSSSESSSQSPSSGSSAAAAAGGAAGIMGGGTGGAAGALSMSSTYDAGSSPLTPFNDPSHHPSPMSSLITSITSSASKTSSLQARVERVCARVCAMGAPMQRRRVSADVGRTGERCEHQVKLRGTRSGRPRAPPASRSIGWMLSPGRTPAIFQYCL